MKLAHLLMALPLLTHTLDDYFSRNAAYGFSGTVLIARGDAVLLRKAYGLADRRRSTAAVPDTPFNIASLDKQFIAAAILRLEDQGKLKTTDALSRFFDYLPSEKRAITIHQLLSHTAGLANDYRDDYPDLTRAAFVRKILVENPLASPPGKEWAYTNSGYVVLEQIVEIASNSPYEEFMRRELFGPAGMTRTTFERPPDGAHYDFWTSDAGLPPGKAVWSTVDDLARWRKVLREGKILSSVSRAKLITPVANDYAYGWNVVRTARGTRLIHHGGSETRGGMLATFRDFVDEDTLVVILSNSMQPLLSADYMGADVEALIFGGSVQMPPPSALPDGKPPVLQVKDPERMFSIVFPDNPPENGIANNAARAAAQRFTGEAGPITRAHTLAVKAFVHDGAPETQSYVRVTFDRGDRLVRVLQFPGGATETSVMSTPPWMEFVLGHSGSGLCGTWTFRLATSATVPCGAE